MESTEERLKRGRGEEEMKRVKEEERQCCMWESGQLCVWQSIHRCKYLFIHVLRTWRVSLLILQLKTLRMDLIRTTVTITIKLRAKLGLSRLCAGALCTKSMRFFHPSLILNLTLGKCWSIHKKITSWTKSPLAQMSKKLQAHVFRG